MTNATTPKDPRTIEMKCKSAALDLAVFAETCLRTAPDLGVRNVRISVIPTAKYREHFPFYVLIERQTPLGEGNVCSGAVQGLVARINCIEANDTPPGFQFTEVSPEHVGSIIDAIYLHRINNPHGHEFFYALNGEIITK